MAEYSFGKGLTLDPGAEMQAGYEKGRQMALQRLIGQAYSATGDARDSLLKQAAMIDPGTTIKAQQSLSALDDAGVKDAVQSMGMAAAAWKAGAKDVAQGFYAKAKPALAQMANGVALPDQLDDTGAKALEQIAAHAAGNANAVQSTYEDAQGNRVAILRNGSTVTLGQNAAHNQIIDTGNGYVGVNKGTLQAAPVMVGGALQAQAAPTQFVGADGRPVQIDPALPPDVQASIRANEGAYANAPNGATAQIGAQPQQLRSMPKPPPQITPYQQAELTMAQQRMAVAQQARDEAAKARQAAEGIKTQQAADKMQKARAAAQDSIDNITDGVRQIDSLLNSPGIKYLGTPEGDLLTKIPVVRNDAKDAHSKLDVIRNRVLLSTLSSLKSLSANGASGFGALSNQEGEILRNSIASLDNAQSNAQLIASLKDVQRVMQRSAQRIRSLQPGSPAASQPATGGWSIQKVTP